MTPISLWDFGLGVFGSASKPASPETLIELGRAVKDQVQILSCKEPPSQAGQDSEFLACVQIFFFLNKEPYNRWLEKEYEDSGENRKPATQPRCRGLSSPLARCLHVESRGYTTSFSEHSLGCPSCCYGRGPGTELCTCVGTHRLCGVSGAWIQRRG